MHTPSKHVLTTSSSQASPVLRHLLLKKPSEKNWKSEKTVLLATECALITIVRRRIQTTRINIIFSLFYTIEQLGYSRPFRTCLQTMFSPVQCSTGFSALLVHAHPRWPSVQPYNLTHTVLSCANGEFGFTFWVCITSFSTQLVPSSHVSSVHFACFPWQPEEPGSHVATAVLLQSNRSANHLLLLLVTFAAAFPFSQPLLCVEWEPLSLAVCLS